MPKTSALARERVAYKRYLRSQDISFSKTASTKDLRALVRKGKS